MVVLFGFGAAAWGQFVVYPKIDAAFNITSLATDPFDYTQTDVRVQIAQPDGTTNSLPAFFDGGTTWRLTWRSARIRRSTRGSGSRPWCGG